MHVWEQNFYSTLKKNGYRLFKPLAEKYSKSVFLAVIANSRYLGPKLYEELYTDICALKGSHQSRLTQNKPCVGFDVSFIRVYGYKVRGVIHETLQKNVTIHLDIVKIFINFSPNEPWGYFEVSCSGVNCPMYSEQPKQQLKPLTPFPMATRF